MVPIIRIVSPEQAVRNVALALEAGCDGVWLINAGDMAPMSTQESVQAVAAHGWSIECTAQRISLRAKPCAANFLGFHQLLMLRDCFQAVREAFPDFWIGVCVPQLNAAQVFSWIEKHCCTADALWLDDLPCTPAEVAWETLGEGFYALQFAVGLRKWFSLEEQTHLQAVKDARRRCSWLGLVVGSIASCGQERLHHDQDSESMGEASQIILRHWASLAGSVCDVIATTGPRDGGPCAAAKLKALAITGPVACLGRSAGGAGAVDLVFIDAGDSCNSGSGGDVWCSGVEVDVARLRDWVLTRGELPDSSTEDSDLQRGCVREMAKAALEEIRGLKPKVDDPERQI